MRSAGAAVLLVVALVAWGVLRDDSGSTRGAVDSRDWTTVETPRMQRQRAKRDQSLDPSTDGWHSEAFAEQAGEQLARVALAWEERDAEGLAGLASPGAEFAPLRPGTLTEVFREGGVVVSRGSADATERGPFGRAVAALFDELGVEAERRVKFKIDRVEPAGEVFKSRVRFEATASLEGKSIQQRATWSCEWRPAADGPPLLTALAVDFYEQTSVDGPWFVDATAAVIGGVASFREQLSYGLNHWLRNVERFHGMDVLSRHGLAVGDANGDGLDDLYLCQPGGLPNRLYIQRPDGRVRDASIESGVNWLDRSSSALFLDLDNDGDQDLVVATEKGVLALENDGKAKFRLRAKLATSSYDVQSMAAADFDGDKLLDIYICVDLGPGARPGEPRPPPFVYHDANDGGANSLYRQTKAWSFRDVTADVGLTVANRRHSLAASWEDIDNDGDPDLYVANDYGQNCLYRNDGGRFKNIAGAAGVIDFGSGMSVSWSDFDRDGDFDLYVGNMYSSAGGRITTQRAFRPSADRSTRALLRRFAKGNSLFRAVGDGTFEEVGDAAGVEMGRWAWSSLFGDLNNDGWDDLVVANGFISTSDTRDL